MRYFKRYIRASKLAPTRRGWLANPFIKISVFIVIGFLLFIDNCYSAFQYLDVGARPLGMGGAYSCIADDANAVIWNPAGLNKASKAEISTMYSQFYTGLIDKLGLSFISFVYPLDDLGAFGIGYIDFGSDLYKENVVTLSYANRMPLMKNILFGINIKSLQKRYGITPYTYLDPTFAQKTSAEGLSYDFGLIYQLNTAISFAVVGKNINKPNINLMKPDIVPAEYRIGIGYGFNKGDIVVEIETLDKSRRDNIINIGGEMWPLNNIGVRCGAGMGTNEYKQIALGASYILGFRNIDLQVDYAYTQNISAVVTAETGNHYVSLGLKF